MKIQFNYVVSATVAFVFIVTTANAKNVPQNPFENNQLSPAKPSARMLFNKIAFPVSHIEAPEKSTTVTKAKNILVTSTVSTTMVASTSVNTIATTTNKAFVPVKNTMATSPIKGTDNNATVKKSIEGTATTQAVKIANVEKVTENQTDENRILIKRETRIKRIVLIHPIPLQRPCKAGYIKMPNGDCKPKFVVN